MKKSKHLIFLMICGLIFGNATEAKKIKNSFRVDKETKVSDKVPNLMEGKEINLNDNLSIQDETLLQSIPDLRKSLFAGYDKELNSNVESFIIVNNTDKLIKGFNVKIVYEDMKGRMLHSRFVKQRCEVPSGESRRMDIKSWDRQHTYYYYLGNEPKKVATPFQVTFQPISIWVEDSE